MAGALGLWRRPMQTHAASATPLLPRAATAKPCSMLHADMPRLPASSSSCPFPSSSPPPSSSIPYRTTTSCNAVSPAGSAAGKISMEQPDIRSISASSQDPVLPCATCSSGPTDRADAPGSTGSSSSTADGSGTGSSSSTADGSSTIADSSTADGKPDQQQVGIKRLTSADLLQYLSRHHDLSDVQLLRGTGKQIDDPDVVKSLVVVVAGAPHIAVLRGADRLSEKKVAQLLCTSRRRVRLVTPEEALQLTGFMTSTVPPVGHSVPLPTLLDAAVTTLKGPIYAGGGDPDVEMVVTVDQLVSHSHARVASIADVPAAGQTPSQPSLSTVDRSPPMQHPPPDDDSSSSSSETPGSLEPAQLSPMPLAAGATAVVAGSALPPTNSVAPNSVTAVPSSQTGPAASPTDATESQTACGLSQTRQYSLPVPWPAGAQHVTLTGVIARKSRIAKLLLFSTLVPLEVPQGCPSPTTPSNTICSRHPIQPHIPASTHPSCSPQAPQQPLRLHRTTAASQQLPGGRLVTTAHLHTTQPQPQELAVQAGHQAVQAIQAGSQAVQGQAVQGQAVPLRRLWSDPVTGRPCEVQLIMGKTIERRLEREAAIQLFDSIRVGGAVSITGHIQPHPPPTPRQPPTSPPTHLASAGHGDQPDVVMRPLNQRHEQRVQWDVVCHEVVVFKSRRAAVAAAAATAAATAGGTATAAAAGATAATASKQAPCAPPDAASAFAASQPATVWCDPAASPAPVPSLTPDKSTHQHRSPTDCTAPQQRNDNDRPPAPTQPHHPAPLLPTSIATQASSVLHPLGSGPLPAGCVQLHLATSAADGGFWTLPKPGPSILWVHDVQGLRQMRAHLTAAVTAAVTASVTAADRAVTAMDATVTGATTGAVPDLPPDSGASSHAPSACDSDSHSSLSLMRMQMGEVVVAVDCEWVPEGRRAAGMMGSGGTGTMRSHKRAGDVVQQVALLQVAMRDTAFLVDLLALGLGASSGPGSVSDQPPRDISMASGDDSGAGAANNGSSAAAMLPETRTSSNDQCASGAVTVSPGLSDHDDGAASAGHSSSLSLPALMTQLTPAQQELGLLMSDITAGGPVTLIGHQLSTDLAVLSNCHPWLARFWGTCAEGAKAGAANLDHDEQQQEQGDAVSEASCNLISAVTADSSGVPVGSSGIAAGSSGGPSCRLPPAVYVTTRQGVRYLDIHALFMETTLAPSNRTARKRAAAQHMSLARLAAQVLGAALDKTQQCTDWEARPLSGSQLTYAACDAYCLIALYDALRARWQ